MLLSFALPAHAGTLLETDTELATAGYFRLNWSADPQPSGYLLQQAKNADFSDARTLFTGKDTARVLSGLPDGDYFYRVRSLDTNDDAWSNPIQVSVRHHPFSRAAGFFIAGLVAFIALIAVLFHGSRQPH